MSKRYKLIMRSKTTFKTDSTVIEVHEGQDVNAIADRVASGYGATVESVEDFFNSNTSVLDILKAGGSIVLKNGYGFDGVPSGEYIDLRLPVGHSGGSCSLNEAGLDEAFIFAAKYVENDEEDE